MHLLAHLRTFALVWILALLAPVALSACSSYDAASDTPYEADDGDDAGDGYGDERDADDGGGSGDDGGTDDGETPDGETPDDETPDDGSDDGSDDEGGYGYGYGSR